MRDWLLYLVIAGALAFAVSSWWGVRRLKAKHTRSAVWEDTHHPGLERQKVAVVLNPIKARASEARALVEGACLAAGCDVVLVGGGDGTVRVVADVLAHSDIAMGLLPLGTGNLLARNIHLDIGNLHGCVEIASFGHQRFIDTARMTVENARTGQSAEHAFLVIAGIGMDAEVVGDTNDGLKKAVGWLAYTEAGVRHLPGRRKRVAISLDDQPEQSRKIRSVLFANCGLIPGGIDFIPQAMIDDGMLDVVVMSPRSAI